MKVKCLHLKRVTTKARGHQIHVQSQGQGSQTPFYHIGYSQVQGAHLKDHQAVTPKEGAVPKGDQLFEVNYTTFINFILLTKVCVM